MIYPDLPYEHALGDGGPRPLTTCIVIHATDNTAGAAAEASYARTRPDKTSAHFYADETEVIQALPTDHIAYGCLYHGNRISIQFELCGLSNHLTDVTLRRAAPIVARVCRDWGIPVRKITAAEVAAGVKGICGHGDITAAFPQDNGDHTDPGAQFPWSTFISYVQEGDDMTGFDDAALRRLESAEAHGYAVRTGAAPDTYINGGTQTVNNGNPLWDKLAAIEAEVKALAAGTAVTLTDAQVAAIAQQLAGQLGGKLDQILTRLGAAGHALES